MACLCEFELGSGDVDLQMASDCSSAEFEKQYAVHVRDQSLSEYAWGQSQSVLQRFQQGSLESASPLSYCH